MNPHTNQDQSLCQSNNLLGIFKPFSVIYQHLLLHSWLVVIQAICSCWSCDGRDVRGKWNWSDRINRNTKTKQVDGISEDNEAIEERDFLDETGDAQDSACCFTTKTFLLPAFSQAWVELSLCKTSNHTGLKRLSVCLFLKQAFNHIIITSKTWPLSYVTVHMTHGMATELIWGKTEITKVLTSECLGSTWDDVPWGSEWRNHQNAVALISHDHWSSTVNPSPLHFMKLSAPSLNLELWLTVVYQLDHIYHNLSCISESLVHSFYFLGRL